MMKAGYLTLAVLGMAVLCGADWTAFRGADGTGIAREESVPTKWAEGEAIGWTADLPGRGLSGPIIVGGRVYLTASSGFDQDRLHILCFDAKTGRKVWHRQFWATGRTMCHDKMCVATPTPASDGERIFAFYSSNDLICVDLDGNLQWVRGLTVDYKNASNSLGMSSSPFVVGDTLIVQAENDSESVAVGVDVVTGENRWKLDRPILANWTSPTLFKGKTPEETAVLLQSGRGLLAVEPRTGKELWSYSESCSVIPSAVVAEGTVYVPSNGLTALEPAGSTAKVLWKKQNLGPATPSPIVLGAGVLSLNSTGVLSCGDIKTGESRWQKRLPGSGGFSATPIAANNHLYLFRENGLALVVDVGDGTQPGEVVAQHDFKETILCTPAIADGAVFVRSDGKLWRLGK